MQEVTFYCCRMRKTEKFVTFMKFFVDIIYKYSGLFGGFHIQEVEMTDSVINR